MQLTCAMDNTVAESRTKVVNLAIEGMLIQCVLSSDVNTIEV